MEVQEISIREHIIRTATRLFYEQGYNLTGINQIIEEAGIAKASLYYHFPSKEDLCVAYLERRNNQWLTGLNAHLAHVADPRQKIVRTFDYRIIFMKENGFGGCGYIKIISEMPQRAEKIDAQVILQKERQRAFFHTNVQQLEGIQRKDAGAMTDTIFLLFDGGTVQSQVYRDAKPLQAARKAVMELLGNYVPSARLKKTVDSGNKTPS